ncbi:hypothetical protein HUS23_08480 [Ectothiorhodospiraceae bacterium 2226]|nr:hypothetical protein HUS23_08480 [Ectothiorhodospiraceae bacterium 2226]
MDKRPDKDQEQTPDPGIGGTSRPASGAGLGPGGAAPPGGTGGSAAATQPGEPFGTAAPEEERERAGVRKAPAAPPVQQGDTRPGDPPREPPEALPSKDEE